MSLGRLGTTELLIILAIVILVFGVGRLSQLGKDLGEGIRAFREGIKGEDESGTEADEKATE